MVLLNKREMFQGRFCALEYRLDSRTEPSSLQGRIILIVIETATADLRLLIDPRWEEFVKPEDHSYLSALWRGLKERVPIAPGSVFGQLMSLSVGPLAVRETGAALEDNPTLWNLASEFDEL